MRWRDEPVSIVLRPVDAFLAAHADLHIPLSGDGAIVLVDDAARRAAERHVAAKRVEQGGLLLGEPFVRSAADGSIALVHVRTAVPSEDATGSAIALRMEAAVWNDARAALRPGEHVVGWFHSHPGIGAFFSDTDRRTQAAFFAQAYSLGWVIDPVRGEEAWFVGPDAQSVSAAFAAPARPPGSA